MNNILIKLANLNNKLHNNLLFRLFHLSVISFVAFTKINNINAPFFYFIFVYLIISVVLNTIYLIGFITNKKAEQN